MSNSRMLLVGSLVLGAVTTVTGCGDDGPELPSASQSKQGADNSYDGDVGCSPTDVRLLEENPDWQIDAETRSCVMPRVSAGSGPGSDGFAEGVAECLSEELGIGTGCTICYARNAECSFEDCGLICLPDPNAQECRNCRCGRTGGADCFAPLDDCTGIPSDYCD